MKSIYTLAIFLMIVNVAQFSKLRRTLADIKVENEKRELQAAVTYLAEKKDFFAALNAVRANPKSLIPDLEQLLKYFEGNTIWIPNKPGLTTQEGPDAVRELIKFLKDSKPLNKMRWSNGLSKTCQDFADWQGPRGNFSFLKFSRQYGARWTWAW